MAHYICLKGVFIMCSIMGYLSLKDYDKFKEGFDETTSRGPDMEKYLEKYNLPKADARRNRKYEQSNHKHGN